MRIASRVIGVVLAIAGVGFFAIGFLLITGTLDNRSVLDASGPSMAERIAGGAVLALGLGLLLGGWYYFQLNPSEIDTKDESPPSRFAVQLIRHRRELKIVALAGLLLSVLRFLQVCFGANWPGSWGTSALSYLSMVLLFLALPMQNARVNRRLNWNLTAEPVRPILRIAGYTVGIAIWTWFAFFCWWQWRHQAPSALLQAIFPIILFSWATLIYGQTNPELTSAD